MQGSWSNFKGAKTLFTRKAIEWAQTGTVSKCDQQGNLDVKQLCLAAESFQFQMWAVTQLISLITVVSLCLDNKSALLQISERQK